jgi:hypothetical protein
MGGLRTCFSISLYTVLVVVLSIKEEEEAYTVVILMT